MGLRKGKRHDGSFPGFCTLLGINFNGKVMAISAKTCVTVMKIASTTTRRYPLRLRNRNLKSFIIILSSSQSHAGRNLFEHPCQLLRLWTIEAIDAGPCLLLYHTA